jgi:hypothetical protein
MVTAQRQVFDIPDPTSPLGFFTNAAIAARGDMASSPGLSAMSAPRRSQPKTSTLQITSYAKTRGSEPVPPSPAVRWT